MNILYLSQARLPSASANSVHVMQMCAALAAQGHSVTLCGYQGATDNCFDYYQTPKTFAIVRFDVNETAGESIRLACRVSYWLLKHRGQFDLIYSRSAVCLRACLVHSIPFVYELHSTPRTRWHRLLERRIFSSEQYQASVFISNALLQYYRQQNPSLANRKTLVLPDAAAPFTPTSTAIELPGTAAVKVGYIGHLYRGKGGETIVRLAQALPHIDFHIIGGRDADIDRLRKMVTTGNVYFHGHVAHSATKAFLSAIEIFLAPYESAVHLANTNADIGQWMSPLKLFEYMSAGRVIICSDLPVLREVMTDEHNCLLAAPQHIDSWKQQLLRVIGNTALRNQLSAAAQQDFADKYTWQRRARQVCHVL